MFQYGYWCSKRCWYIWLLNVTMVFEFLIFIGIEFHSLRPLLRQLFVPLLFFNNLTVWQWYWGSAFLVVNTHSITLLENYWNVFWKLVSTNVMNYAPGGPILLVSLMIVKATPSVLKSGKHCPHKCLFKIFLIFIYNLRGLYLQ